MQNDIKHYLMLFLNIFSENAYHLLHIQSDRICIQFSKIIRFLSKCLCCYSASALKLQFTDRYVDSLGHIFLIPSQPVFVLSP